MYRVGANTLGIALGGAKDVEINANGIVALQNYVKFADVKSTGTNGGTFTSGAWRTRDLSSTPIGSNTIAGASVTSNQISLTAGTYYLSASAPAEQSTSASFAKARLYNVSDSATLLVGTTGYIAIPNSGNSHVRSIVTGVITLAGTKTIELQHQITSTQATSGFGTAAGFSEDEIYSMVEIWRLA